MQNGSFNATPEARLLIHVARRTMDDARVKQIRSLAAQGLNWDKVLKIAQRNGLLPLLFFHLSRNCPEVMPAEPSQFLRDYFQKNSAFNLLLTGELLRLLTVFEENGIRPICYKGPAMAMMLYGNITLRQFCDLDIMVPEVDVWRATDLLIVRGFEPHFDIPPARRQAFIRLGYVRLFRREAGRILVELHWRLASRFFGVRFDARGLEQRAATIELQGTRVFAPAAEDLLLMLSVHGAKDLWEKLEWVAGIAELIRGTPDLDWPRVLRQAKWMRCERMLLLALQLAEDLLEAPVPVAVLARIRDCRGLVERANEIAEGFSADIAPPRGLRAQLAFHLALKDKSIDKLRYCARLALTTTPVDWATMPLPGPLSFAYPLLRAARLTKKYAFGAEHNT